MIIFCSHEGKSEIVFCRGDSPEEVWQETQTETCISDYFGRSVLFHSLQWLLVAVASIPVKQLFV